MKYEELELLWKQYDNKLDNLEKINRKLLKDKLLEKSQKRLNCIEFNSLYGLIAVPIILLIALHPNFKIDNFDWKLILGCLFVLGVVLYLCIENLRTYFILKKIDLSTETAFQSLEKIVRLKSISNNIRKSVVIYYPILYWGVILIGWNSFVFSFNTILFLSILFIVTYYINIWGVRKYKERMNKLEKDVLELEEYTE
jgi:hypothetical protein